jgi:DNA-binding CsgD family transcriptional regulator
MLNLEVLTKYAPHVEILAHQEKPGTRSNNVYINRFQAYGAVCHVNHFRGIDDAPQRKKQHLTVNEESALILRAMGLSNAQAAKVLNKDIETIKDQSSGGFGKMRLRGQGAISAATRRLAALEIIQFEQPIVLPEQFKGVRDITLKHIDDFSIGKTADKLTEMDGSPSVIDTISTRIRTFYEDCGIEHHHQSAVFYAIGSGLLQIATANGPAVPPPDTIFRT